MAKTAKPKQLSAADAIAQAKKNSVARKAQASKQLMLKALSHIEEMVEQGIVECIVPLSQDEYTWGSQMVSIDLQALGYEVLFQDDHPDDPESIPDLKISIEHLK